MDKNQLLRKLPKVDDLLRLLRSHPGCQDLSEVHLRDGIRETLDNLRSQILAERADAVPEEDVLLSMMTAAAQEKAQYSLRPVINATGIVLHTNLGRAVLAQPVAEHVCQVAMEYTTLEYNLAAGGRGSRYTHVEELVCQLTGSEAALVVNNNAAAVLLILTALCQGKEVIVSRGELVEIGGSFRVPDIMEQGGAFLREVGTTNKTRLSDYENAIQPGITGALLKVHTSNFKVVGFTEEADTASMVALAKKHGIPMIYDLGSGALADLQEMGLGAEPSVLDGTSGSADVISFSGDKLLGGPQAGIIIGSKDYIQKLKAHPLTRALRIDKLTLAALEATLRLYLEERLREVPTIRMLSEKPERLYERAKVLEALLCPLEGQCEMKVQETQGQVGGGSVPGQMLCSWAVAILPKTMSVDALEQRMRRWETPIIGRIYKDHYLMDVRTLEERHLETIAKALIQTVTQGEDRV